MPRYFFHTNNPREQTTQDDEGFEFASLHDAKGQAVAYAGRLLCNVGEKFWDDADFELVVTDDRGLILFSMRVFGTESPAIALLDRRD